MRRFLPVLIIIIGVVALIIDFWPGLKLPDFGNPDGGSRPVETKLGLDLSGGLRVEYQALPAGGKTPSQGDLNTIKDIIERRVNATGVSEPLVQTQGSDRIVVEIPGVSDPDSIRKLIGATGRLDFVPLPTDRFGSNTNPGPERADQGQPLPTPAIPPLFSGDQISSANPGTDSAGGRAVAFSLKDQGSKLFADYTTANVGNFFAIVLDGAVVSAPYIQSPITGGSGIITGGSGGGFTAAEMNNLVTILRYGSLPFPIQEISIRAISSSLAGFSLDAALLGGAVGIFIVLLFMLIYYRLPGVVADFTLLYYAIVVLAIFRLIPVTLTLAGIAAFVLSMGMAVDANILIFERMKEELRLGKSLPAAVEAGFNRAWNSILDSNVSSLITAVILYWFGSATIRGFALILIIGVLTSMFTAVVVTRTILRGIVQADFARRASLWNVSEDEFLSRPAAGRPVRGEARGRV
jgi:protein-export membrane protein SecD